MSLVLQAPTCVIFALKTGRNRYEIFAEPRGEAGRRVHRRERSKVLAERIHAYASRLEHYCLRYPYQWFNFYDFWAPAGSAPPADGDPQAAPEARGKPG